MAGTEILVDFFISGKERDTEFGMSYWTHLWDLEYHSLHAYWHPLRDRLDADPETFMTAHIEPSSEAHELFRRIAVGLLSQFEGILEYEEVVYDSELVRVHGDLSKLG
jgi:hypothetical protein